MLPVAHVPLGEPEIERVQHLPQTPLRDRSGRLGPRDEDLGLYSVVVGEELERLDLLRADAAVSRRYPAHGLVTRLVG